jgi:hypothetical protein
LATSYLLPKGQDYLVPLRVPLAELPPATTVRSTLLASSLKSIRARGHYDRYLALLEEAWREPILEAVAGQWLPLEAGLAHYRACDALGLSVQEQVAIGKEVGDRIQGTFLSTMIRAAKTAGVTPWTALGYTGKLYERLFEGGGCSVARLGPKDARADLVNNPVVGMPYFRNGFRGLYQVGVELFCARAYVTEIMDATTEKSCALRISWA